MDAPRVTVTKAIIGMAASTGSFVISVLAQFEAWLRVLSLLVGMSVGVLSFISIYRKMGHRNKKRRHGHPHDFH